MKMKTGTEKNRSPDTVKIKKSFFIPVSFIISAEVIILT